MHEAFLEGNRRRKCCPLAAESHGARIGGARDAPELANAQPMAVPAHQHASRRPSAGRGRQRLRAESHPRLDLRGPILGAPPPVLPCDWQADGEQADLVLRGARRPIIQHVALLLSTNRPSAHRCAIPSTSSCVADGWGVLLLSAGSRGRWRMRRSQRRRASSRRASPPAPAPVSPLNRFPSAGCEWCHCSRPAPRPWCSAGSADIATM